MLKTTEITDIKEVLKSYSSYGFADESALTNAINFVATQAQILMQDIIGISYYAYLQNLDGVYVDNAQSATYWGEVYLIARELLNYAIKKNLTNATGYSISTEGYSASQSGGSGNVSWFESDRKEYNNEYIKWMYTAGYKVNQAGGKRPYFSYEQGVNI